MSDDDFVYSSDGKVYCKQCETKAMSSSAAHVMLHIHVLAA